MNIRLKMIALVAFFIILFGFVFVSREVMQRNSFVTLFKEQARDKEEEVFDKILVLKEASLKTLADDYTYWDEMVNFVASADVEWAKQNLDVSLSTYSASAVWVYRPDFSPVYSVNNLEGQELKTLPLTPEILSKIFAQSRSVHFFLNTTQGLLEVMGRTIHPTADPERKTVPAGFFFAARLWSEDYIREIAELTGSTIRITSFGEEEVFVGRINPEQGAISFSRVLNSWDGRPLARINVWIESASIKEFNRIMGRHMVGLVALILIALGFIMFFSLRRISMPLRAISRALNTQQLSHIAKIKGQNNEFGNLARLIERFFAQNEELIRQIKQRKDAEAAVRESEERLRSTMDNLGIGVALIDPQMKVLSLNNQMRRWFGEIDVSQGPICYRVFNHPAYEYPCRDCAVAQTLHDGMIHEVVRRIVMGGIEKYYKLVATPLRKGNQITAVIEIVEDVTEAKRFEERLTKINECFLQFGADPVLNIEFLTLLCGSLLQAKNVVYSRLEREALRRITGWNVTIDSGLDYGIEGHLSCEVVRTARPEPFLVRNLPDTSYAQTDPNVSRFKLQTYFGHAVKCRGKYVGALGIAYDRDYVPSEEDKKVVGLIASAIGIEEERYFVQEDLKKSIEDSEKQRRATLNILEDMDEARRKLVQVNEELKHTQSQLIQTSKMAAVGQLASGVAHEINNPLTGVLNNVQLIKIESAAKQGGFSIDDFKELLNVVEESALRCKKITQSLLDFSHASKGQFGRMSLNEMLLRVFVLIEHEMKLQNIVIDKQLEPDMPAISGDAQLLQQVIFNLVTNARWAIQKKSAREGGVITVKSRYDRDNKAEVLTVTDTGIGIKKDDLERIFEPFFTTKPIGEGTGLGLSLVYGIINSHNGTIGVDSQENIGTTFTISLPA